MFRADRLKALMLERGISQSALARLIVVSPTTIWKLLNEPVQGSKHLHKIARELGTTPAYLSGETDDADISASAVEFSPEERECVALLRLLRASDRKAVIHLIRALAVSEQMTTVRAD